MPEPNRPTQLGIYATYAKYVRTYMGGDAHRYATYDIMAPTIQ